MQRGSREFYGWRGNEHLNPGHGGRMGDFGRGGIPAQEALGRPEPRFGQIPSSRDRIGSLGGSFDSYRRNGDGRGYSARPGMAFVNPSRGFGDARGYGRGNSFDGRGYGGYGGSFGRQQKSGGFHVFGHGHNSNSYAGGRSSHGFFGSGHDSRAFRSGGFGGGKMPTMKMPKQHSFGDGHFGGGHSSHFGGGHSGGGHSSGGHGDSHHR